MLKTISSITNAIGALNYKGTWNASTNTPTLVSSVGVKGDYYQVSVAGSTAINGISNWGVGDVIAFNGVVWQRIEGGADLNGVNLSVSGTTTLSGLTASTALALDANKNVVSVTNTGTADNVLATSPSITTPRVITSINDTNGNELFGVTATASAVNEFTVANAATGNAPTLSATGSDTNIGMALTPKGTGGVIFPAGAVGTPAITTSGDLNTGIYFPAADTIAFTEGGVEAARIDSSGNLLVGITSTINSARVVAKRGVDRDVQMVLANTLENYGRLQFSDSANYYIGGGGFGADYTAGSGVGMNFNVALNTTPATATLTTAGVWTNASDARYKENIVNSPYGLNEVMQLNPVQYNMIGQEQKQIGLIAQDVLPIIPEVVESVYCEPLDEDRYTLSYGNLVSVCVKAIQELKAELDTVKAELATLKGQ